VLSTEGHQPEQEQRAQWVRGTVVSGGDARVMTCDRPPSHAPPPHATIDGQQREILEIADRNKCKPSQRVVAFRAGGGSRV